MAKRRRQNSKASQRHRAKQGRGVGTGPNYTPYLFIHDVPSIGLASRVFGWTTSRVHHVLSRLELRYFYCQEWRLDVVDIREQFPLDLEETLAIANQLGVRHPRNPRTREWDVRTSDFVLTVRKHFGVEDNIRTIKYKKDLNNARVMEKLEIERVYWEEVRGLDWKIVTEDDIDTTLAANVEWVHGHREIERLFPLTAADVVRIEQILTPLVVQGKHRLRDLTNECDSRLNLSPGSSLSVVRYLIANRRWEVDMSTRIMPPLPLILTATPALNIRLAS